jgi:hypothetical protein
MYLKIPLYLMILNCRKYLLSLTYLLNLMNLMYLMSLQLPL